MIAVRVNTQLDSSVASFLSLQEGIRGTLTHSVPGANAPPTPAKKHLRVGVLIRMLIGPPAGEAEQVR